MDTDKAVKYLNDHAEDAPKGLCARYVRQAIEAGGCDLTHHPLSAKDYEPILLAVGFKIHYKFREMGKPEPTETAIAEATAPDDPKHWIGFYAWDAVLNQCRGVIPISYSNSQKEYVATKGDIVVIQPYNGGSPHGHIAMYNGTQWVSDFKQRDMWGGPGYRKHKPNAIIYRP